MMKATPARCLLARLLFRDFAYPDCLLSALPLNLDGDLAQLFVDAHNRGIGERAVNSFYLVASF